MYIRHYHQGTQSKRKSVVIVVSCKSTRSVWKGGKTAKKVKIYSEMPCAPDENFKWADVLSRVEFKRTKNAMHPPPTSYGVKKYTPPTQQYMDLLKEMKEMKEMQERQEKQKVAEPLCSTGVPAASTSKISNSRKLPHISACHFLTDPPPNGSTKRSKSNNEQNDEDKEKEPIKLPAIVQNGMYVGAMFSAHIARQHVISCMVNDDVICIWYFDRQNAIQCSGFNFVQDLPRFLVLLLIMQGMQHAQWGMNLLFGPEPGFSPTVVVEDKDKRQVDLTFNLESEDCTTHFGLRACATNVFPVTSDMLSSLPQDHHSLNATNDLVTKLYLPEEMHQSEPDILKEVYKIVDKEREGMTAEERQQAPGHVPEKVWFHKFEEASTANIRRALGIDNTERGSRVFYII
ncbi:hypothetical protein AZE42_06970, partial [Rhizopogon vesiculosus]